MSTFRTSNYHIYRFFDDANYLSSCTVVPVLVLAATGLYGKIVINNRRPRRRRPRHNLVPGPRTDLVSGPTAPPVQGQVPAIPGP